jgi:membrane protein implicated in regulation of membrane protease activity
MGLDQAFFLAIALFGALFLLVSFVLGEVGDALDSVGDVIGEQFDIGGGGGFEGGLDGHADGPSPLSLRNLMAFMTAYGASGLITSAFGWSTLASSLFAVVPGIAVAGLAYKVMQTLYSQQSSSVVEVAGLVGRHGVIDLTVPAAGLGRVTLNTGSGQSTFLARSEAGQTIPTGTPVVVKATVGSDLVVATMPDGGRG